MFITNSTGFKLRFSVAEAISEDDMEEKFAYIIGKGCGLSIPDDNYSVSIEKDQDAEKYEEDKLIEEILAKESENSPIHIDKVREYLKKALEITK